MSVVRVLGRTDFGRHPNASDFGIVIEVSDSSLDSDRNDKMKIYAFDRIPIYWIANIPDRQIEVYELQTGNRENATYSQTTIYKDGDSVPVVFAGQTLGLIPVTDVMP